tara:strand:- start:628 stop:957 length:330 start_codon:yes stop_codon:yes gene_type:complete
MDFGKTFREQAPQLLTLPPLDLAASSIDLQGEGSVAVIFARSPTSAAEMFRLLLVAIACASCAALQPSALVSTRTAQRPAASALTMKHPDYFVRVARTEAGRPRLSVYR